MDNPMLWWSLADVPTKHIFLSLCKALERFCIRFPTELPTIIACDADGYGKLYYAVTHQYHASDRPDLAIPASMVGTEKDLLAVYDKRVFFNSWYIGGRALGQEVVKERV